MSMYSAPYESGDWNSGKYRITGPRVKKTDTGYRITGPRVKLREEQDTPTTPTNPIVDPAPDLSGGDATASTAGVLQSGTTQSYGAPVSQTASDKMMRPKKDKPSRVLARKMAMRRQEFTL